MDEIEVIETEWGSPLHRELIAHKARLRAEWMRSPEAAEEALKLKNAPRLEWERVVPLKQFQKRIPVYVWRR
jgi:hypothetical protein